MKARKTPEEIRSLIAEKIPAGLVVSEHTETEHWYRHTPSGVLLPSVTTVTSVLQAPHLKVWAATVALDFIEARTEQIQPGAVLPTELRSGALMAHKDIFDDAGDIGTQGHGIIEAYLKDWLAKGAQPTDIQNFISGDDHRLWAITRSAEQFFNDYYTIPIASELKVAYIPKKPENGFAGTLDALMYVAFPERDGNNASCEHEVALTGSKWDELNCWKCDAKWKYYFTLVDFKTSNSIRDKDEYYMQTSAYWKSIQQMIGIKPERIVIVRLDKHQKKYELVEVLNPALAYKSFAHLKSVYDYQKLEMERKATSLSGKDVISIDDL